MFKLAIIIFSVLIISIIIYFIIKPKSSNIALVNLQNKIMSLINGQMSLNNLKVIGSLNIISSNPSDNYPLKLLSSSNKNVITFSQYGVPYNEFGVISNSTPNPSNFKPTLSTTNIKSPIELSISSLQKQINDIVSGKTPLNNLYVMNKLTVVGGGRVKIISDNLYELNGGLSVINKDVNNNILNSLILFEGNAGRGQYGLSKVYTDSSNKLVYDIYSSNVNYKNTNWDSRSVLPSCAPSNNPTIEPQIQNSTDIQSLEKQFNNIVNGITPINNLVVNGYIIVDSNLDSPLTLDVQSCDPTSLVGFNNLDARGVNGYGGPFDWFGPYFDSTKTITYSGKNISTM